MIFLAAAAAAVLSSACSIFSGEKQPPGPDLSKMTPKERADYEAFVNARQRFYEKKYKAQKSGAASRKDAQFTDQTGAQPAAQAAARTTTDQPAAQTAAQTAAQAADQAAAQPPAPEDKKRKRYSVEKRERLSDMTRPVLLQDSEKSIFSWKENSGRRSESLHEKQEAGRSSAFGY